MKAMVPFADTLELLRNSGLDETALIVVGNDHRLADPESLAMMAMTIQVKSLGDRPTKA